MWRQNFHELPDIQFFNRSSRPRRSQSGLHLESNISIQIVIHPYILDKSFESYQIELEVPASYTVHMVKQLIFKEVGVQIPIQRLVYDHSVLNNRKRIESCFIDEGKRLHMVPTQKWDIKN